MIKSVNVRFLDHGSYTAKLDLPDTCPHCGQTIVPEIIFSETSSDNYQDRALDTHLLVRCPHPDCRKYFALEYHPIDSSRSNVNLIKYSYRPPIEAKLPDNIEKVSEEFVTIYSQATKAESEKLEKIAGVGYRKALEFLIKDFAILKSPNDEESIKKMPLMQVIDKYFDDLPKIKSLAKASTWIGNDETHYLRKHDDKDVNDLKSFINSAALFIAADYKADEALSFTSK